MKGHGRKPRSYKDNTHALCFHTYFLANREHLVRPEAPNRAHPCACRAEKQPGCGAPARAGCAPVQARSGARRFVCGRGLGGKLPVVLPARPDLALRRRGGAPQHRAPRAGLAHAEPAAVGHGMAAAAAPAQRAVRYQRLDVAQRRRRLDRLHAGLRGGRPRDVSPGSRPRFALPTPANATTAFAGDPALRRVAGGSPAGAQSRSALHAGHGDDGIAVSGDGDLGGRLLRRSDARAGFACRNLRFGSPAQFWAEGRATVEIARTLRHRASRRHAHAL